MKYFKVLAALAALVLLVSAVDARIMTYKSYDLNKNCRISLSEVSAAKSLATAKVNLWIGKQIPLSEVVVYINYYNEAVKAWASGANTCS